MLKSLAQGFSAIAQGFSQIAFPFGNGRSAPKPRKSSNPSQQDWDNMRGDWERVLHGLRVEVAEAHENWKNNPKRKYPDNKWGEQ